MTGDFTSRLFEEGERRDKGRAGFRDMRSVATRAFGDVYRAAGDIPKGNRFSHHANSESPIEAMLAIALVSFSPIRLTPIRDRTVAEIVTIARENTETKLLLFQQVSYDTWNGEATYRLDFLVSLRTAHGVKLLCVEADGARYHGETINQVIRDHVRDAHLAAGGIHTVRFTGRQIRNDCGGCVDLIHMILRGWGCKDLG